MDLAGRAESHHFFLTFYLQWRAYGGRHVIYLIRPSWILVLRSRKS